MSGMSLIAADRHGSDVTVVEDVVLYPTVGMRLAKALHDVSCATPIWREMAVLHTVAVATDVRSGLKCVITVGCIDRGCLVAAWRHGPLWMVVAQWLASMDPANHGLASSQCSDVTGGAPFECIRCVLPRPSARGRFTWR